MCVLVCPTCVMKRSESVCAGVSYLCHEQEGEREREASRNCGQELWLDCLRGKTRASESKKE